MSGHAAQFSLVYQGWGTAMPKISLEAKAWPGTRKPWFISGMFATCTRMHRSSDSEIIVLKR